MRRTLFLLSLGLASVRADGQQPPQTPCGGHRWREFDFWIGEWEVRSPAGQVVAQSSITRILAGCVVKESYTLLGGPYRGESYNTWDRRTGRWHQTWVDNGGLLAQFDGGLEGNAMVMRGAGATPDGKPFMSRMTFTPRQDGTVRQLWERSDDGEKSWSVMFDGVYVRRAPES